MSCIAGDWIPRPRGRYRPCYDEHGKSCCRAEVLEVRDGEWLVRVRRGKAVAVNVGTRSSQAAALDLGNMKLAECGCSGSGIALGATCRRR